MPSASPLLDDLLTRWTDQRSRTRRDVETSLDVLSARRQDLDDHRAALRKKHQQALDRFEKELDLLDIKWNSRLQSVDEWKTRLSRIEYDRRRMESKMTAVVFFDRTSVLSHRLSIRLAVHAARLEERDRQLHDHLEQWLPLLETKESEIQALKQKAASLDRPFLVSRGRRQPE